MHGSQFRNTSAGLINARRVAGMLVTAAAAMALGGCASKDGTTTEIASLRTVALEEFSTTDAPATGAQPALATSASADSTPATSDATSTPTAAANASNQSTAANRAPARAMSPGDENVVESVIGQVSGRPVFADEFLEPIADQLRSEGARLSHEDFMASASEIINRHLSEVILNELFLAEAEAALTPQQQMGLLAFLKDLQEKSIAERGGTIFGASKKIAEEQDMTLEEFEKAQKDEALIRNLLYERVAPRVIVSWRDVQREYELRKSEFNPPATITLRRLALSNTDQKDLVDQVKTQLAAGAGFDAVVSELALGPHVTLPGGDGRFTLPAEGLSGIEIADTLKAALVKLNLEAGQTTEPIERGGETLWLNIQSIDQSPPKSLYDVQEQLIGELNMRRFNEERDKYINSLLQRGIYDEMEQMRKRVLAVALLRYGR